jgi:LPS-assembly lipoprotein
MKRLAPFFAPLLAFAITGCGLTPLYQGGMKGTSGALMNHVAISAIEGKAGWLVRDALYQRLGQVDGTPRFRLDVRLDDQITGFGVRRDDAVTRERRTLRARYKLVDVSNGAVLLDATAGSDAGVDVVSSEYATLAAENTALENLSQTVADQIVAKVALTARQQK